MIIKKTLFAATLISAALFVSCADEAEKKNPDSEKVADQANEVKTETNTAENDAEALVALSSQEHYLHAAADYAAKNANQKQVKDLAAKIKADHMTLGSEIKAFAGKRNYTVPDSMSNDFAKDVADMKDWKKGKEFDTKYVDEVIDEHEKVINKLENCSKDTKDADLKAWCDKTLPGLRAHLEEGRRVKDEIKTIYKS
ncbi:MAG: DUF4142 domain-containing protein [Chitinophagaceae bacterium]|nr:DUF4142 domain-containing protein [Chitinophagaceae bacterium]